MKFEVLIKQHSAVIVVHWWVEKSRSEFQFLEDKRNWRKRKKKHLDIPTIFTLYESIITREKYQISRAPTLLGNARI